jgi:PAS domain S-box-containing protein
MGISRMSDGKIIEVNESWEKLFGYQRREVIGKSSLQLGLFVNLLDREAAMAILTKDGRVRDFETLVRSKTGAVHTVLLSIERLDTGNEERMLTIIRDITGRKRSEEQIRSQAEMLDQTYDAVFAWDFEAGIIYWNRSSERLYGYSREEVLGKETHELFKTVFPMSRDKFHSELMKRGRWEGEIVHTIKDGSQILVESRFVLTRQKNGKSVVLETTHDITELKRRKKDYSIPKKIYGSRSARHRCLPGNWT